jgi:hypothetical protein
MKERQHGDETRKPVCKHTFKFPAKAEEADLEDSTGFLRDFAA